MGEVTFHHLQICEICDEKSEIGGREKNQYDQRCRAKGGRGKKRKNNHATLMARESTETHHNFQDSPYT